MTDEELLQLSCDARALDHLAARARVEITPAQSSDGHLGYQIVSRGKVLYPIDHDSVAHLDNVEDWLRE